MDHYETVSFVVAGVVMPISTVLGILWVTAVSNLPWVVPLFLLLLSPLFAAGSFYVAGVRMGALHRPDWLPVGDPQTRGAAPTYGDQIPDRHHETFTPESLGRAVSDADGSTNRLLALAIVYLVSIPGYTVLFLLLSSA